MNLIDLDKTQIRTLVEIAQKGGKRRAMWNHRRWNDLERLGLTEVTNRGKVYHTHRLTSLGIQHVLALPDDYSADFYPLPSDIAHAKRWARYLRGDVPHKP